MCVMKMIRQNLGTIIITASGSHTQDHHQLYHDLHDPLQAKPHLYISTKVWTAASLTAAWGSLMDCTMLGISLLTVRLPAPWAFKVFWSSSRTSSLTLLFLWVKADVIFSKSGWGAIVASINLQRAMLAFSLTTSLVSPNLSSTEERMVFR